MSAALIGRASSAGNCRIRKVRSTNLFSSPSITRSRNRVVPGVCARRLCHLALSDFLLSSAWMVRTVRTPTSCGG
jgi:hypothetical protein